MKITKGIEIKLISMAYLLIDRVDGTKKKLTVNPAQTLTYPVHQGDDVQIVDQSGKYLSGQAVPDGSDLRLLLADNSEVRLARFYNFSPEAAPITVVLDLVSEDDWAVDDDVEIQIEEPETLFEPTTKVFEQITFCYEVLSRSGELMMQSLTVEVNSSNNCPLSIAAE